MERFSNILYEFVRLQDSWWANHTTGLPRSFSFSRMIMPMSVIAFIIFHGCHDRREYNTPNADAPLPSLPK